MKIVAIIQARMGSTRLPGKVLKYVLNKPILAYQVERVKQSGLIDDIIIATSRKAQDDAIVKWCLDNEVKYYRGEEEDVLKRYYETAKLLSADTVVRLTGDCPIIDPRIIDSVIHSFLNHDASYVSNTIHRTFPRGMDTEVFTVESLTQAHHHAITPFEKEHVTPYIRSHYPTLNVTNKIDYSFHRWTVDTIEDFYLIEKIVHELYPINPSFAMEDVILFLESNPNWMLFNKHIKQKDEK